MSQAAAPKPCEFDPCPGETLVPQGAPSAVDGRERVLRSVPSRAHLQLNGKGELRLAPIKLRTDDLKGKDGRNLSALRSITSPEETVRRLKALNREDGWENDPVRATASVKKLRECEFESLRLLCVYADPITDELGACPTHAGILKTKPVPDTKTQIEWLVVKTALSEALSDIAHVSGEPVSSLDLGEKAAKT